MTLTSNLTAGWKQVQGPVSNKHLDLLMFLVLVVEMGSGAYMTLIIFSSALCEEDKQASEDTHSELKERKPSLPSVAAYISYYEF